MLKLLCEPSVISEQAGIQEENYLYCHIHKPSFLFGRYVGVICAILTICGAKYDTQNLNVQKHIQIREAVLRAVFYHLQHKLSFETIFPKQVAVSAVHQWTITTTFFVAMVFTETLSENLLPALSSLQLEFHLHKLLGREFICVPKLRFCHGCSSGCASMHWCEKQGQNWKYDTTKHLNSRQDMHIKFLFCLRAFKWVANAAFFLNHWNKMKGRQ